MSIKVAIAGNPNSGKTTLFNALAKTHHTTGNWPGVTVEKREANVEYQNQLLTMVDLPGIYSLSPYSLEEVVAREYLINEKPDVILNIIDATNLERNLYLTTQLIETGIPLVIALNMMDELEKKALSIKTEKLAEKLGAPVVPIVAVKAKGLNNLLETVISKIKFADKYQPVKIPYNREIEDKITELTAKWSKDGTPITSTTRYLALKFIEQDNITFESLSLERNAEQAEYYEEKIVDDRYSFVTSIVKDIVVKIPNRENRYKKFDKIDTFLTGKYTGIPFFALMMYLVFSLTFTLGNIGADLVESLVGSLSTVTNNLLTNAGAAEWLSSLVIDGIIGGVGGVLVFLPNIMILFFAITLLEDSGYMARVAFIFDRLMRGLGLSGKAVIPMIIGFGCSVPAIMGTRTLETHKDRLTTMLVVPFISCSARYPIYVMLTSIFFPGRETSVMLALYFLGIVVAILSALLFKKLLFKSEEKPFIMELPPYRMPSWRTTGINVWLKIKEYIWRAGTIIFAASVVIWFMLNFNLNGAVPMEQSFAADIGRIIAPLLSGAGLGQWQLAVVLITGVLAKEAVVSTMSVIFGGVSGLSATAFSALTGLTTVGALSFMVFTLLYMPCVAAIGVIKQESGSWKWAIFSLAYSTIVAGIIATLVYQIGNLIF